eukprot:TRINITY_DN23773_c0_g1_i2.p2 TRINITY_DN23773_c0_g1~~TRINITY_DN23773_c0_g1_i2.p2  ORF type:complete len:168 (+),score=21.98 TRINITY_DN23773_c0_g1_i2:39-506(+)
MVDMLYPCRQLLAYSLPNDSGGGGELVTAPITSMNTATTTDHRDASGPPATPARQTPQLNGSRSADEEETVPRHCGQNHGQASANGRKNGSAGVSSTFPATSSAELAIAFSAELATAVGWDVGVSANAAASKVAAIVAAAAIETGGHLLVSPAGH